MTITSRSHFILLTTTAYAVFSLLWIFLSDRLLAQFADLDAIQRLSTAKGVFYVAISTAMFYLALCAVPAARGISTDPFGHAAALNPTSQREFRWLSYFFAVALPVSLLAARAYMPPDISDRPMMVVLMLPIIVSALLGGLWPGVLATVISALGVDYLALKPIHCFAIDNDIDLLQWSFLIGNGLAVSVLSELLRRALTRANAQRRLLDTVVSGTSDAIFVKDVLGRYLLINEAGAKMAGTPTSAIVGHDDTEIFPLNPLSF